MIKNVKEILKLMEKTLLALKFSQEIRAETRISHFNLKGEMVCRFTFGGGAGGGGGVFGGYMFRIIYL